MGRANARRRRTATTIARVSTGVLSTTALGTVLVGLAVTPARADFTQLTTSTNQTAIAADAQCGEQLHDVIFGLQVAEQVADAAGLAAEAVGAAFIVSEIPGVLAQAAALALGVAAFALEEEAGAKPSCETDILGSLTVQAGGANITGDSIFNNELEVTGLLDANGGANITGGATISGGLTVNGDSIFNNNVAVAGDLTVGGTLSANALASATGVSAHGGAIWLGDVGGATFQPGISIGGGAVAGVGTGAAQSSTGHVNAIAIGNGANATQSGGIAFGLNASSTAANAVAVGTGATSNASAATAVGNAATASGANASAFGANASALALDSVAFGSSASASASAATAVGRSSTAGGANAAALGAGSSAAGASSVAVGHGSNASQAGAVAVGQTASATGVDAIAIGRGAQATGSIAVGAGAFASNGGGAFGDGARATGTNAAAFGTNATAAFANSIAIGSNSITTLDNTVSFGTPGNERRLMNVDEGVLGFDAVNVNQLTRAVNKLNRGMAASAALSTPLMGLEPGETEVSVGGGFYEGENGVALRVAHRLDTELPFMVSGGIATAGADSTVGQVGLSLKF